MSKTLNFIHYSRYYDTLYEKKNTAGECEYIMNTLKKFGVKGNKYLEFGAGSGRHGHTFLNCGIKWSGIEKSEEMINLGKDKGLPIIKGDIGLHLKIDKKVDAVLAIFHVISYLNENESLLNSLKNANIALENEGIFLFDVWYSPAVYCEKPEKRVKKVSSKDFEITRNATPTINWNSDTVKVHYDIEVVEKHTGKKTVFSEDHLMRHFSLPELKLLALVSGFEFIHAEEWMTQNAPSNSTWGITCIFKKKSLP